MQTTCISLSGFWGAEIRSTSSSQIKEGCNAILGLEQFLANLISFPEEMLYHTANHFFSVFSYFVMFWAKTLSFQLIYFQFLSFQLIYFQFLSFELICAITYQFSADLFSVSQFWADLG